MIHRLMAINFKVVYFARLPTKPAPLQVSYTIGYGTVLPDMQNGAFGE
jgi:hypothetical protein